ncbi:MAG: hypothetical protein EPO68_10340 [Planctomycetota bacterium]|nr:MAG: hypothetical protein EPO68_10340 [Planctomycetota bacterium]
MERVLIGLDGGATELKAHEVVSLFGGLYELGPCREVRAWRDDPRACFEPAPLAQQLEQQLEQQRASLVERASELSREERAAGDAWVELTADAIAALARAAGAREVELGACFPGLKTRDARGIAVSKNGPRIPDFAARIEAAVEARGVRVAAPLRALWSDGYCCGVGEEHAASGAFRGVRDAYYVGGGTGIAEAFKLDGRVRSLDELAPRFHKAWELEVAPGLTFEDELAPSRINARWRALAPGPHGREFVELAAGDGDPRAAELLERAGACAAALCFERLTRARSNPERPQVLERIVVGQRLGQILDDAGGAVLRAAWHEHLAAMLAGCRDVELERAWLRAGELVAERLVVSKLRAAPALGAAVLARELVTA